MSEASAAGLRERGSRLEQTAVWVGLLVAIWIIGSILVYGRDVIIPIAIAIMIWQLINGIARLYGKLAVFGQELSPFFCKAAAIATIFCMGWIVVDIAASNVAAVRLAAPEYEQNLRQLLGQFEAPKMLEQLPSLRQMFGQIDVPAAIGTLSSALGGLVGNAGLVAIYVAFLLAEQAVFGRKMEALFKDGKKRAKTQEALTELEFRIERYLWIKSVVSLLTAFLCYLVLMVVGVDYAVFWALVIFLLNFIPNIGSLFAVIFPSLLTVLQFGSFGMGIGVLVALAAVQFAVGNFVEPRMLGNSLNLSPLVIILSLTIWGAIWGVAGMFLCVPMTVILAIALSHFETTRGIAILLSSNGQIGR